ncbi:phosphatase PAP2 family protein [Streptomyces sp. ACA25]|uniref:bifunctional phosphatase PAP2/diacylglycerol kinase family protein n=1 Tax=Streptomyces sp. ACA25 TaxID=3022596 RepID=UPI0023072462|nr:bifunctional phosphatase PAP2/diacylglycerol kinase family protein [Streptomyces sp. ACA25]MDB1086162.1 phosphatase PAP2 family protein [Streptomyces sp. ACA25]
MGRAHDLDLRLFEKVAGSRLPGMAVLPRLTRAADHGKLWLGTAAVMAATGGPTARRAARRGIGALVVASLTANTVMKYATRRSRPLLDSVPTVRRLPRPPRTHSFPSGHSASAAAFAAGVALESTRHGALVAPVAAAVAASRVYVGAHYPGDVVAGVALGLGAAALTCRWWPPRPEHHRMTHHPAAAPALQEGAGLIAVVNRSAGPDSARPLLPPVERLRLLLPQAEIIEQSAADDLGDLLDRAARDAAANGGVLGICGGDGSVNAAAVRAADHGVPLAVFPGGTLNHFALDTGIRTFEDTALALGRGEAVRVDLARARPADGASGPTVHFVNTFSVGLYPDLVRMRERLEGRIGKWPAAAVSLTRLLRTARPMEISLNGRPQKLWLLFAGNSLYSPEGPAPAHRTQLDDGLLDIRTVDANKRLARTRVVVSALTGTLGRSRVHTAARLPRLHLSGLRQARALAYDGEAGPVPDTLYLDKRDGALTVYRPATDESEALQRARTIAAGATAAYQQRGR